MNFKKIQSYLPIFIVLSVVLFIFKNWFLPGTLAAADWIYLFPKAASELAPFSAWETKNYGFGYSTLPTLWVESYFSSSSRFFSFLPWSLYERLFLFWPFLLLALTSSYLFVKKILKDHLYALLGSVIYSLNSYSLLLVGGGQMGVALAYSFFLIPLVFFLKSFERSSIKNSIYLGILIATLIMLDLRVSYIFYFVIFLYFLYNSLFDRRNFKIFARRVVFCLVLPAFVAAALHLFWILPIVLLRYNPVSQFSEVYSSIKAVIFFSFAKFENTISLLHPNWPENIFGKTSFMKPEFLLLPIFGFGSLLFKRSQRLIFFMVLALVGAFLAKGANEPFGQVYLWMFDSIPGFVMFRDPTKWYLLVSIAYAILIPFGILEFSKILPAVKFRYKFVFSFLMLGYFFILLYPAFSRELSGTFRHREIPIEYIQLADFLSRERDFSRTFWIPTAQRFGYKSYNLPAISANDYFDREGKRFNVNLLTDERILKRLKESSVKYIIVPYDSEEEIFLRDRKYDEKVYLENVEKIRKVKGLKEIKRFGKIVVLQVSESTDRFWSKNEDMIVDYKFISPTEYEVDLKNVKKDDQLFFTDSYDKGWEAKLGSYQIESASHNRSNSFKLPRDGNYILDVYYAPQRLVNIGLILSALSLGALILLLVGLRLKK